MKHKHYECIIAWAEGKLIQFRNSDGYWEDLNREGFGWWAHREYRIKPETKQKEYYDEDTFDIQYLYIYNDSKNKIIRVRPTLLIEPLDWVFMGKVRLEK
jgi:hypothetical protein